MIMCSWLFCRSKEGSVTAAQALVIGGISRTLSTACVLPFTVVKARYEVCIIIGGGGAGYL